MIKMDYIVSKMSFPLKGFDVYVNTLQCALAYLEIRRLLWALTQENEDPRCCDNGQTCDNLEPGEPGDECLWT